MPWYLRTALTSLTAFALALPVASAQETAAADSAAPAPAAAATAAPSAKKKLLPVAVTLSSNAEGHAAQVAYVVESAVRRSLRHEYLDPVEKFDPDGVTSRATNRRRAEDAVAFGRKQYESLDEGLGIESFNRAISAYEQSALWDTFRGLSHATVMRILVKWAEDQTVTRREIVRLLAMDPRAEFPPELTPPELAAEVKRAREVRNNEPKFAIDVNSEPVASRVYVNGVFRGTTPASVRGLTQGEHYLTLVAPGYKMVQKTVMVGPGATATERLEPAERARPFLTFLERIRTGFGGAEEVNASRVLARATGADEVLVVGVTRNAGRLTIEMHRLVTSDGHAVAVDSINVAENDPQLAVRVDELATRVLANDRPRGEHGKPLGVRTEIQKMVDGLTSVSDETVRLSVGIGAGVLVASGVVLGVLANQKEAELRALYQKDPRVGPLSSSGFTMALTSDLLTGAGLIAASTWAWMQFGRKATAKTEMTPPPVLERSRPSDPPKEEKKKKKSDEWDPWAAQDSGPAWVRPTVGFGSLGVEVGF